MVSVSEEVGQSRVCIAYLADNLEGEVLDVVLNLLLVELASNETFLEHVSLGSKSRFLGGTHDVEDGPVGVARVLVLCGVSNKALLVGEGDPGGSDTVTLVVDHDLNLSVLHNADTRVGGTQIDTDDGAGDTRGLVVLDRGLVLSAGGLRHHETGDEDEEKIEGDGPCRAALGAPRWPRHCG